MSPLTSTPSSRPAAGSWRLHAIWERVFVAAVAAILVAPGLGTLAGAGGTGRAAAERHEMPATVPVSWWETWRTWPKAVAARFERTFAFRDALVEGQAVVRYFGFGVSPQPEVIRGRDGWLFYAGDGGREDLLSQTPLSAAELDTWATTLQRTQDALAARGIAYVFVVAPDKPQIYPEFLPSSIRPASTVTRADQLVAHLRAHTSVHVVDPRAALLAAKSDARLYHRTDSHWNDAGAIVAARLVLAALDRQAPRLGLHTEALAPGRFARQERITPAMDLARMLRLTGWLRETRIDLVPRHGRAARVVEPVDGDPEFGEPRVATARADGRGPRALVYRDSFGSALIPFLGDAFARAVFLWEYDVDPAAVDRERPDVVIHEWASRRLHTRLPYDMVGAASRQQ